MNIIGRARKEPFISKIRRLLRSGTLALAVKGELGHLITRIGERIGSESLVYNDWTFAGFHRTAVDIGPTFVDAVITLFPEARRAVDLGAGTGFYVQLMRQRGINAEGYEYSHRARRIAQKLLGLKLNEFDLPGFSGVRLHADLCICIEVAEHIPNQHSELLVAACASAADAVIFSAAPPGQAGQGHINLQPPAFWNTLFLKNGMHCDGDKTAKLSEAMKVTGSRGRHIVRNICVYTREVASRRMSLATASKLPKSR
jgi:hypothetical protein